MKKMSKMPIPLYNRVLLKSTSVDQITPGGIILATKADDVLRAEVMSVGPGIWVDGNLIPMSVKPGDIIAHDRTHTDTILVDGETYLLIEESNILCILPQ
jgi:chaperonin GroES